jgi:hypothetical protein
MPKRPRIVPPQYVVGDTEDVETGRSVKVDQRAKRKLAVAPARVGVKLAQ